MNEDKQQKIITIIPAYHDSASVCRILTQFETGLVDEICLVIDCPTNEELMKIQRTISSINVPVHIISNGQKKGVGNALRRGIAYGVESGYGAAVIIAGNGKDDPTEIPQLLEPILKEGYDYVQGSRFLPGGRRVKNPLFRSVFSKIYPFFWTLFTGVHCTDVTNGFRAYRLSIVSDKRINIWQNWLGGYELEYYLHYKVLTSGYRFKEVPVSKTYSHRHKGGYSHIRPFHDWWGIVGPLVYLKLRARQ